MDSRLSTVDGIKSLVQEETQSPAEIHPSGTVLVEGRIIPQERQEIDYHKHKSSQSD